MSHAIHDFTAKLRQPSLLPQVKAYVAWRRSLAQARAAGLAEPEPPDQAPLSINLDLTTACNYRCDHCIDWDILNTKHRYNESVLRETVAAMAQRGLRSVILIGGGEPTLYPGFVGFVGFLKSLALDVAVVSNGSRGDRLLEIADGLDVRDWVRLSLDSGSNELFRAMHKPVRKSLTLDEICSWIPKLKKRNPRFRVGFSYIIVWSGAARGDVAIHENIHEIVMATERAKAFGFDYIALKPILERTAEGAEVMDGTHAKVVEIRREVDKALALADERFDVYVSTNLRVLEKGNWHEYTRQPRTCHMQALRHVLTPIGRFNCPAHRGVGKARIAGKEVAMPQRELAALMDRFDASEECREVTCLYNPVNWWLEKMIEDPQGDLAAGEERHDFFL